jgi:hypothetical protein
MISPPDKVPLAQLPRELQQLTGVRAPGYRTLYNAVLDAVIPAELITGRWYVDRSHLPAIAMKLGMATLTPLPQRDDPSERQTVQ